MSTRTHRSHRHGHRRSSTPVEQRLTVALLFVLVGLSPWLRGGNRQVALVVLLALGLALLALMASQLSYGATVAKVWTQTDDLGARASSMTTAGSMPKWKQVLILAVGTSPVWVGLLQLVPLPAGLWAGLAGREPYLAALSAGGVTVNGPLPLSLNPTATWASIWAAVPVSATFLAAFFVPNRTVYPLVKLVLALGVAQVVLGLTQYASGGLASPLMFGSEGGSMIGTFGNRNSLADYFAIMLPLWFVVLLHMDRRDKSKRLSDATTVTSLLKPLWYMCGFAFLISLISTQSRGGLLASTVVMVVALVVYLATKSEEDLSRKARWTIGVFMLVFATVALLAAGADKVTSRIGNQTLLLDAETRNTYALATAQAGIQFWPWGSGIGTFESVFPRFQALQSLGYVNEAHNDYAQIFMELGALGVAIVLAVLILVAHQAMALRRKTRGDRRLHTAEATQWLAGCAVLALALHSWVDFNMRIPALAITAALLMGFFLRPIDPYGER